MNILLAISCSLFFLLFEDFSILDSSQKLSYNSIAMSLISILTVILIWILFFVFKFRQVDHKRTYYILTVFAIIIVYELLVPRAYIKSTYLDYLRNGAIESARVSLISDEPLYSKTGNQIGIRIKYSLEIPKENDPNNTFLKRIAILPKYDPLYIFLREGDASFDQYFKQISTPNGNLSKELTSMLEEKNLYNLYDLSAEINSNESKYHYIYSTYPNGDSGHDYESLNLEGEVVSISPLPLAWNTYTLNQQLNYKNSPWQIITPSISYTITEDFVPSFIREGDTTIYDNGDKKKSVSCINFREEKKNSRIQFDQLMAGDLKTDYRLSVGLSAMKMSPLPYGIPEYLLHLPLYRLRKVFGLPTKNRYELGAFYNNALREAGGRICDK